MKPHRILRTFSGSQHGNDGPHHFAAGTEAHLSDDLARIALGQGWVEPVEGHAAKAEDRDTKVIDPEETKPDEAEERKGKRNGKK